MTPHKKQTEPDRHELTFYVLLAMTAITPLFFLPVLNETFSLSNFALIVFGATALIALSAMRFLRGGKAVVPGDHVTLGLLASLAVLATASTVFSVHWPTSIFGSYGRYQGFATLAAFFIVFLASSQVDWRQSGRLSTLFVTAAFVGAALSILGILQVFGLNLVFSSSTSWSAERAAATLGNPVFLGTYLAMVLPLIVGEAMARRQTDIVQSALMYAAAVIVVGGLIASSTRSAWLGALLGLLVMLAGAPAVDKRKLLASVGVIAVVAGVWTAVASPGGLGGITGRVSEGLSMTGSARHRLESWKIGSRLVAERPLLGSGPDTTGLVFPRYITTDYLRAAGPLTQENNIHSYPLELALTLGVPFMLVWLVLVFRTMALTYAHPVERAPAATWRRLGISGAIVAYLVSTSITVDAPVVGVLFWMLLGILAGRGKASDEGKPATSGQPPQPLTRLIVVLPVAVLLLTVWSQVGKMLVADARYLAGADYVIAQDHTRAIELFESATILNPYVNDYREARGRELMALRGTVPIEEEIAVFAEAARVNPYRWINHVRLANAHLAAASGADLEAHIAAAESSMRRADLLKPLSPVSRHIWASIYLTKGNKPAARKMLELSLELYPEYAPAKELLLQITR